MSRNVGCVFGMSRTYIGKWAGAFEMLLSVLPSITGLCVCFCGQCGHIEVTVLFPAKPCGHVFCTRSANISRNRSMEIRNFTTAV
jgi:hypothetical protein